MRTTSAYSADAAVACVQKQLRDLGYQVGTPDGVYGKNTRNAFAAYYATLPARIKRKNPVLANSNARIWCELISKRVPKLAGYFAKLGDTTAGLDSQTAALFAELPARTKWQLVAEIKLNFETYHPQGLTKIGDIYYLSSVKVIEPTKRFGRKVGGYDRTAGSGEGYLFKFDSRGRLLQKIQLGNGAIYHPGGMGYDGRWLWVPVAEYRPDSSSIVYRVDPNKLGAIAVLRFDDHIGDVVRNLKSGTLNGVSWGSRRAYTWKINEAGNVVDPSASPGSIARPRGIRDIDYQDCQYVGGVHAICGGLTSQTRWGGLDLVDLSASKAVHQVPVPMKSPKTGKVLTSNPVFAEAMEDHIRFYFAPDDNATTLFVYDAFAQ